MRHLGIYYSPLDLGYSSGKTLPPANPPFRGGNQVIEIQRQDNAWIYRFDPKDERVVMRKANRPHAHWYFWLQRKTAEEARRELLNLQGKHEEANHDQ
jgi:hypothetical protein